MGVEGAEAVLDNPHALADEVMQEVRTYAAGVRGVPFFIIDGKYKLSGAQPTEVFEEIFQDLANEE